MRPVSIGMDAGIEPRITLSPWNASSRHDDYEKQLLRRGSAVRRSRRGLLTRWLKPAITALALVVGPTMLVTWLMVSPRFAVRDLAIITGDRVTEAWVREALAPVVGENLPRLALAHAELLLRDHPWVRGVDLRKDLPARLAVRVEERRAVALLRTGDELYYLDAEGSRIAPFEPSSEGADLPLISVTGPDLIESSTVEAPAAPGTASDRTAGPREMPNTDRRGEAADLRSAIRLLSEVDEVELSWTAGLSEIEILSEDDFRVHTSALPFSVLVRTGTLNLRARRLEELLPHIKRYGAAAVDLRFARRIIVQPSVEPGSGPSRPAPKTEHREANSNHAQRG